MTESESENEGIQQAPQQRLDTPYSRQPTPPNTSPPPSLLKDFTLRTQNAPHAGDSPSQRGQRHSHSPAAPATQQHLHHDPASRKNVRRPTVTKRRKRL